MKKTALFLLLILATSCYKESFIPIEGDFETSFVNADESVPVLIHIKNQLKGAETFEWDFEGGNPSNATSANPGDVLYTQPGTYTITLTASNSDGETKIIKKTIEIKDGLNAAFSYSIVDNNFSPVEVQITNTTQGQGITYNWSFQNGVPSSFSGQNPPNVTFTSPGQHQLSLTISNGFETQTIQSSVAVAPLLVSDFSWTVGVSDADYEAPVTLQLNNQSISATQYLWSSTGGSFSNNTAQNPILTFNTPGSYQITLTASNSKATQSFTKNITIHPNTNLYTFSNVKFGINSAHHNNSNGAFFSTITQQSYTANQVNNQNSSQIDIAFQGLNSSFSSNKLISPNQVTNYGFLSLTSAQNTIFINSQNLCNCGLNFTVAQFDAMSNDNPLQSLIINPSVAGAQEFGNFFPRIILFKTQDGRKGAIKITNMVNNGTNSYIVCDIKVQKQ
ncbi:PKD domain-containing protein [Flavobacterium psychrophilum]|uniref:PKD domain-containing protein n=1 Tax=Flavobacterium psychrophilum TaxID=96345 RepID=UPI0029DD2BC7|nr:PKD domain-containing protein [Flavobacterium psychrophilum]MEB3379939.1 PKD domain-containing protein [Flavobacterium psychrophilum]